MQIHLLPAGKLEQQVERAGEPVDVDDQRRLGLALVGDAGFLEIELLRHGLRLAVATRFARPIRRPGTNPELRRSGHHRKRGVEPGAGVHRIERLRPGGAMRASAASARRTGLPVSAGATSATAVISSITPLQCRAMSQPACSAAVGPLAAACR